MNEHALLALSLVVNVFLLFAVLLLAQERNVYRAEVYHLHSEDAQHAHDLTQQVLDETVSLQAQIQSILDDAQQ